MELQQLAEIKENSELGNIYYPSIRFKSQSRFNHQYAHTDAYEVNRPRFEARHIRSPVKYKVTPLKFNNISFEENNIGEGNIISGQGYKILPSVSMNNATSNDDVSKQYKLNEITETLGKIEQLGLT